jgi:hypothetical protein
VKRAYKAKKEYRRSLFLRIKGGEINLASGAWSSAELAYLSKKARQMSCQT